MWEAIIVGFGVLTVLIGAGVWAVPQLPPRYRTRAYETLPITRDLVDTQSSIETSGSGIHHTINDAAVCAEFKSYVDENDPKGTPNSNPQTLTIESGHVYAQFQNGDARTYLQMDDERSVLSELITAAVARRYQNYGLLMAVNGVVFLLIGALLLWL